MDLFNENITTENSHPKYDFLLKLPEHRKKLEEWFNGFNDRDNKITKEFKLTFHSSFWEIYLFAVFKELNYKINMDFARPDFILQFDQENVLIEATIANIKQNGKPEDGRNINNYLKMFMPPHCQINFTYELNEAIVRYSNAINSKKKMYEDKYTDCEWINLSDPYVIALSSYSQIDFGREYIYGILALLYGYYFDNNENKYRYKDKIKKNDSKAEIDLGLFNNNNYENISAIIFSCTTTIGKLTSSIKSENENYNANNVYCLYQDLVDDEIPYKMNIVSTESQELLQDGLFVLHNPFAKNPLNISYFDDPGITQIFIDEKRKLNFLGNLCPTVARLDIPLILANCIEDYLFSQVEAFNSK